MSTMQRVQVGMDIYVNADQFTAMCDEQAKSLLARVTPNMVKLTGYDSSDNPVSCGSGFMYSEQATNIITCDHLRFWTDSSGQKQPVARFKARYASDGAEEAVVVVVTAPSPHLDIMLLSGTRAAPKALHGARTAVGSTVYTAGFAPDSNNLSFCPGAVTSTTFGFFSLSAHADNGWSGGPVINNQGAVVAVINRGAGSVIKWAEAISVDHVQQFLTTCGHPGFLA